MSAAKDSEDSSWISIDLSKRIAYSIVSSSQIVSQEKPIMQKSRKLYKKSIFSNNNSNSMTFEGSANSGASKHNS